MIALLSAALVSLFATQLVAVVRMECGTQAYFLAPGLLALSLGAGLLSRMRLPYLGACFGVVLLSFVRGPLDALLLELLGAGSARVWLSVLLGLVPLGFLLGRQLAPHLERTVLPAVLGVVCAALAIAWGAVAWLPAAWLSGPLLAVALASLAEAGRHRGGAPEHAGEGPSAWLALPLATSATLIWLALARHVPSYVAPSGDVGSESFLALLLPALLVALPARVLCARPGIGQRIGQSVGLLALAYAAWMLAFSLSLHSFTELYRQRTWEWRGVAQHWSPWLDEWRVWLLIFGGWSAAALGLALGSLGKRVAGPALLGVGVGFLAQEWSAAGADENAQRLVVLAAGIATLGAVWPWQRRAWIALPLAVVALSLFPQDRRDALLAIRRVGEMSANLAQRDRLGDVQLFGTGGRSNLSPDGRDAYRRSFTGDRGLLPHPLEMATVERDNEPATAELPIPYQGMRIAGVGAYEGAAPTGPEGCVGRFLRVFHRRGPAVALGLGAELIAAELWQLEPNRELRWSSDLPLNTVLNAQLLAELELPPTLSSLLAEHRVDALETALSSNASGGWSLVSLSPERARWPLAGRVFTTGLLTRVRDSLNDGGRCVAFLDTQDLDQRALAGRLASFGAVFGKQSFALVEARELSAPYLILVGWRDASAAPRVEDLLPKLACPQRTGRRAILDSAHDLAALILLTGEDLDSLSESVPTLSARRPLPPTRGKTGWSALAGLRHFAASRSPALPWLPIAPGSAWDVAEALSGFDPERFDVDRPAGTMSVQVAEDTDWVAFDNLIDGLAEALRRDAQNPLLPVILAALLEPLVEYTEYGRFGAAWERVGADVLPGWRLQQLLAKVAGAMQEDELAAQAAERAGTWAASRFNKVGAGER